MTLQSGCVALGADIALSVVQDLLMVSYLANVVRVNLEVSTRASMLHDARLAPRVA